jgi:hypothetical protein
MVVKARTASSVSTVYGTTPFALYLQPRTSELMWRVPYDNQSRAAGPVGIGHTPQQLACYYNELKQEKQRFYQEKVPVVQAFIAQAAMKSIVIRIPEISAYLKSYKTHTTQ